MLPARALPTPRTRWRNRRSVRRRASGRSHYNYFRDYDSAVGRYVESDPIGLMGGLNTYVYAGNGPVGKSDPLGLLTPYGLISQLMDMLRMHYPTCNKAEKAYCQDLCASQGWLFIKCRARTMTVRNIDYTQIKRLWPPDCHCEPPGAQCLLGIFQPAPAPLFQGSAPFELSPVLP